jgi:hypothetical protein
MPTRLRGDHHRVETTPPTSWCRQTSRVVDDPVDFTWFYRRVARSETGQFTPWISLRLETVIGQECVQAAADQLGFRDAKPFRLSGGLCIELVGDGDGDGLHVATIHYCCGIDYIVTMV